MKILLFLPIILFHLAVTGQIVTYEISAIEKSLDTIQLKQAELDKKLQQVLIVLNKSKLDIQALGQRDEVLYRSLDSLKTVFDGLQKTQTVARTTTNGKIRETNNILASTQSVVKNRTIGGGIIIIIILFTLSVISWYLTKRIKQGNSSIDKVRKAQDALQTAHLKMQEVAVKLDHRMMELFERQMVSASITAMGTQIDHSLVLKVADEIVRIEMNLSRMDASIKGYKQLIKAVQRIKDNFNANGYEIVDMLGKPYVAGIKAAVTFIIDENLEHGQQIITKIIKPQINYQQQMIQAAQIEVSQPE
ncbi:MAG: hypothetical protein OSJ36_02400 [Odoribacter sp.]|nr:hypothetical protein [Odoribacter sp.]